MRTLLEAAVASVAILITFWASHAKALGQGDDFRAAYASEYPALETQALQEEFLSVLTRIDPGYPFPPNEFSDMNEKIRTLSHAPYCYLPRADRERFYFFSSSTVIPGASSVVDEVRERFRSACSNMSVFAGRHGNSIAWIVVYNIPADVTPNVSRDLISYREGERHLLILPMRAVPLNDFANVAKARALAEFTMPWEQ